MCIGVQVDCGSESHFDFNGVKEFVTKLSQRIFHS